MDEDVNRTNLNKAKLSKVSIVILNWNGWKDTIECLECIFRIKYPNYQVIVVDNGSDNDSFERIKAWAEGRQEVLTPEPTHPLYPLSHPPVQKPIPYIEYDRNTAEAGGLPEREKLLSDKLPKSIPHPMILIETGENLGFAGGNNVGIKYVMKKGGCDYILLLNNDTVVEDDFLEPLLESANENPKVGVVGGKINYFSNPNRIWFAGGKFSLCKAKAYHIGVNKLDDGKYRGERRTTFVTGCLMLINIKVLQTIGLIDENYFLYFEDLDFCYRAIKFGWQLKVNLSSKIFHKVGKSQRYNEDISAVEVYYSTKSRLYFAYKYLNPFQRFIFYIYFLLGRCIRLIQWEIEGRKDLAASVIKAMLGK